MIEKIQIQFNVPILDQISSIQNVEFVNTPGSKLKESDYGALIIQTSTALWLSSNLSGNYEVLAGSEMAKVKMTRGYNSYFYYAQNIGDSDCVVNELKLSNISQEWHSEILEVYKVNEGTVIALEMDPDNRDQTDSIYTYKNKLKEERSTVLNKIFVIDDKENMFQLR